MVHMRRGATVQNPGIRGRDFGIRFDQTEWGVCVTDVIPGSPAQRIGLEQGDVIVGVYGYPVHYAGAWDWLMSHELNYLQLRIRDGRTGGFVTRDVSLDRFERSSASAREGRFSEAWQE
jgi:predicted metalloprotease with PDZ domain